MDQINKPHWLVDHNKLGMPDSAMPIGSILIVPSMDDGGDSIGIAVGVEGSMSVLEVMGLLEAAKVQYLQGKANG